MGQWFFLDFALNQIILSLNRVMTGQEKDHPVLLHLLWKYLGQINGIKPWASLSSAPNIRSHTRWLHFIRCVLGFGLLGFWALDSFTVMIDAKLWDNLSALFYLLSDRSLCALLPGKDNDMMVCEFWEPWLVNAVFPNAVVVLTDRVHLGLAILKAHHDVLVRLPGYKSSFKQSRPMALSRFTSLPFFVQHPLSEKRPRNGGFHYCYHTQQVFHGSNTHILTHICSKDKSWRRLTTTAT